MITAITNTEPSRFSIRRRPIASNYCETICSEVCEIEKLSSRHSRLIPEGSPFGECSLWLACSLLNLGCCCKAALSGKFILLSPTHYHHQLMDVQRHFIYCASISLI